MEIYTKTTQEIISETLDRRHKKFTEIVPMAKRLARIEALREKHGLRITDNSKTYYQRLNSPQGTQAKAKRLAKRAAQFNQLINQQVKAAY
ncbi:hypothetical protein [Thalassotalea eurytherma]|uniref:Uncharacterized protein n=1 Tax=Thalassotalea eurytherma TaxID=1144278 RepID=A0ABQ6GY56_9GAMM|nr:hypothetical protein [Thalassotalea eurytherma]GLX80878.1 hypothetical protein theurythT_03300 [Thalassotalea eurytherma]